MSKNPSKIKIDVHSGIIEIAAREEKIVEILEQISTILPKLKLSDSIKDKSQESTKTTETVIEDNTAYKSAKKPRKRVRAKKLSGTENSNTTKMGSPFYRNFEPIDLKITDEKEIEITAFYKSKRRSNMKDKTLIASYIAANPLNKEHFNYDDLYQIMRTCGEDSPPGNLSENCGKLIEDNFLVNEEQGLRLKIQGQDEVEKNMNVDTEDT